MEQGSREWLDTRAGRLTGSRFAVIMGSGSTREDLLRDLAWERFTGRALETYQNDAMRRGTELEPEARDWYSFTAGVAVRQFGFIAHADHDFIGISPDGLVGDDGLIEIKCPGHRAHMEVLKSRKVPAKYRWQVQGQLWVTRRKWADFVSYHPEHDGVILRVEADEEKQKELEAGCLAANAEVEQWLSLLTTKAA